MSHNVFPRVAALVRAHRYYHYGKIWHVWLMWLPHFLMGIFPGMPIRPKDKA